MPITSIVVMVLVIYIFFSKKTVKNKMIDIFSLALIFCLFNNQGYFVKIAGIELFETNKLLGWILVVYSLLNYKHIKLPKISFLLGAGFCIVVFCEILFSIAYPYPDLLVELRQGGAWDEYAAGDFYKSYLEIQPLTTMKAFVFNIVYFSYITVLMKALCDKSYIILVLNRVMWGYKFVILYGCMELIFKDIFHFESMVFDISGLLFGVNDNSIVTQIGSRLGGNLYNLQGFTREPSHFIISLFIFTLFAFILLEIKRKGSIEVNVSYRWVMVAMLLSVVSGSFSAIFSLLILLFVYVYFRNDLYYTNIVYAVLCSVPLIAIIVFMGYLFFYVFEDELSYYINRLVDGIYILSQLISSGIILDTGNDGMRSTLARFTSIIETSKALSERPFVGLGYRLQWCHDIIISMLADIGILGLMVWWKFVTSSYRNYKYDNLFMIIVIFIFGLPFGMSNMYYSISMAFLIECTALYTRKI